MFPTLQKTHKLQQVHSHPATDFLQLANIRMRLHGVTTNLLRVDCQNLLSTGLLQVVSTSCNKSANDKLRQT